jgi:hypothetical protein
MVLANLYIGCCGITEMPPLLAALLMLEFGCTITIVQAIDDNMEWRRDWAHQEWIRSNYCAKAWYTGYIGMTCDNLEWGTYLWPSEWRRKY